MAAILFICPRTFFRRLYRFPERSCHPGSSALCFSNNRSKFRHEHPFFHKKGLNKTKNSCSPVLVSPGSYHIAFVRTTSSHLQRSLMTDLKSSPPPALFLGFSGALPFCGLATVSIIFPQHLELIAHAQQAYGACILSFLGAIHWGYALAKSSELKTDWGTLGYSVTPSLIAWLALLCKPGAGLITLCTGLGIALSRDLTIPYFPAWYYALRKALSTLAISSICITSVSLYLH